MRTKKEILALINSEACFDYELDPGNSDSNIRCVACNGCNTCEDCFHCEKSTGCIDCEYCEACVNCIGCKNCTNIRNCINCNDLGCNDDCFGYSEKYKYMIDNHQFSKQQYEIFKEKYLKSIAEKNRYVLKDYKFGLLISRLARYTNE